MSIGGSSGVYMRGQERPGELDRDRWRWLSDVGERVEAERKDKGKEGDAPGQTANEEGERVERRAEVGHSEMRRARNVVARSASRERQAPDEPARSPFRLGLGQRTGRRCCFEQGGEVSEAAAVEH
jgi:hypothetical protein